LALPDGTIDEMQGHVHGAAAQQFILFDGGDESHGDHPGMITGITLARNPGHTLVGIGSFGGELLQSLARTEQTRVRIGYGVTCC
jgi:hypothetical protein